MKTVPDIFSDLGGPAAVARALGIGTSTVSEMKRRGSIPTEYWWALIDTARSRGFLEIDAEALVLAHARKRTTEVPAISVGPSDQPGHFSRFFDRARPHFTTAREVDDHIDALRDEWQHR